MKNIIKAFAVGILAFGAVSCDDFLNRPTEDNYTTEQYYKNDEQCEQGVNYLYNSPWYDIIRFYIYGSETMCGNVYQGQSAYSTLTVNGTDGDLKNMSYSLWAVSAPTLSLSRLSHSMTFGRSAALNSPLRETAGTISSAAPTMT